MLNPDVTLVEVGPRDGLQNELKNIPTDLKIKFINALSDTGLRVIECTSFVSAKWVPQMADQHEVMQRIERKPHVIYTALVPNIQGLNGAIASKTQEICVFTAASETFALKNTNCTIEQSLNRIKQVIAKARENKIRVRGYISCTLGCPYEGEIPPQRVADLATQLIELGCYQISLGDTIGVGTAHKAKQLIKLVKESIPTEKIAMHFHDTYAQALTNIYVSLEEGIRTFDSSVAGLGGCPYAPGAGGNVATEDVIYLLNGLGLTTGVDLSKITQAGRMICDYLQIQPRSKVALALAKNCFNAESPSGR